MATKKVQASKGFIHSGRCWTIFLCSEVQRVFSPKSCRGNLFNPTPQDEFSAPNASVHSDTIAHLTSFTLDVGSCDQNPFWIQRTWHLSSCMRMAMEQNHWLYHINDRLLASCPVWARRNVNPGERQWNSQRYIPIVHFRRLCPSPGRMFFHGSQTILRIYIAIIKFLRRLIHSHCSTHEHPSSFFCSCYTPPTPPAKYVGSTNCLQNS